MINSKIHSNNIFGIRGVSYLKGERKWRVEIGILGKQRYSIGYDNMLDATKARFKAEQKYGYPNHLSGLSDACHHILKHDPSYILKHKPNDEQIKECLKAIKDMTNF